MKVQKFVTVFHLDAAGYLHILYCLMARTFRLDDDCLHETQALKKYKKNMKKK